jgi:8-oxo-dGTP pyrophosphatase MutT (NUDIX family)
MKRRESAAVDYNRIRNLLTVAAENLQAPPRASFRRYASELTYGRYEGPVPAGARRASVVMLIYPRQDGWCLPLTLRPTSLPVHAGQISLPGGIVETGESSRDAALRELYEELGVSSDSIEVIGPLSDIYIFGSNHVVTPWLAVTPHEPNWRPNKTEVEEVIEVMLDQLLDDATLQTGSRSFRAVEFQSPFFEFGRHQVWGATCTMLGELVDLLGNSEYPTDCQATTS